MQLISFFKHLTRCFAVALFLFSGLAFAQAEPTLTEIYATAKAGKLDQAQVMIQQVLISHPNSAKAHFVAAELFARQGKAGLAGESLATAEKIAPGLAFAKPEAVQQLRTQIAASSASSKQVNKPQNPASASAATSSTPSWALPLLLAAGVIGMAFFFFRKKTATAMSGPSAYASSPAIGSGLNANNPAPAMAGGYAQPGYGQPGYGQPAPGGMGGRVMGGLATGLAVGAGVMAAQAIGKSLMGEQDTGSKANESQNNFEPMHGNPDMGGQDFGINDTSSWDDGGGVSDGGSWDN